MRGLVAGLVWAGGLSLMVAAQVAGGDLNGGARAHRDYVSYAAEPATVSAGRRSVLEVHLRVAEGFHVNSHRPKSELLIPTAATLAPGDAAVKVGEIEYPAGTNFSFEANPGETLDVYTGAVMLRVPVMAAAGEHTLKGSLRYQACDHQACYPPKMLALEVPFTAK